MENTSDAYKAKVWEVDFPLRRSQRNVNRQCEQVSGESRSELRRAAMPLRQRIIHLRSGHVAATLRADFLIGSDGLPSMCILRLPVAYELHTTAMVQRLATAQRFTAANAAMHSDRGEMQEVKVIRLSCPTLAELFSLETRKPEHKALARRRQKHEEAISVFAHLCDLAFSALPASCRLTFATRRLRDGIAIVADCGSVRYLQEALNVAGMGLALSYSSSSQLGRHRRDSVDANRSCNDTVICQAALSGGVMRLISASILLVGLSG